MTFKLAIKVLLSIISTLLIFSCASQKPKSGFELQKEVWDYAEDKQDKGIYLTGTKSIDSIDPNKLIYDFFRIEIDKYPDTVRLYARVYDSTGNFITNMADPYKRNPRDNYFNSLKEFLGKVYNVKEVDVRNFWVREFGANDSIPYNIVLTIDYSGSMRGVLDAIYAGTEIFVDLKFPYDKIAISTFNREFDLKVPLSDNKQTIINLFNLKKDQGMGLFSAVFDAVMSNLKIFDNTTKEVPRVLVIFSDGDDNYSKKEISEIIQTAKEKNVHIFSVAFGYSKDEQLRYLAKYTGGKFYKAYSKDQLISVFRDIYMSLRFYYLITYNPPKFWGYHKVRSYLEIPGRIDSLYAEIDYNTSDLMPWDKIGTAFTRPINFDFNKSEIKPESIPIIEEIVDVMLSNPKLKLEIQGHTDNIGGIEFNLKLSEARALAVFNALVERGVDSSRLRYRGFGFSRPVANNDTEEGRAKNRRTEFVVLAK